MVKMAFQKTNIPLAYFITFTCYGTWLHGQKAISVDRYHNTPGTDFIPYTPEKAKRMKKWMCEKPYLLDSLRRRIVLKAIRKVWTYHQWTLLATHIRTNHVHVVVHAIAVPEKIMAIIKAYASRYLNEAKLDQNRSNRWTRHGSTRYLWKEEEIEATIQYVVHEQGEPMAVFENKERYFVRGI